VLEAGSAAGLLVYPPLEERESYHVTFEGEGRYRFDYSINPTGAKWEPIFSVAFQLPVGGVGAIKEDVTMMVRATPESRETALLMARMFVAVDDLGTPAGAVTLRGAWSFQTPPGWDTIYTPIFNNRHEVLIRPAQLLRVKRTAPDVYEFDFTDVRRWVRLAMKSGMVVEPT